MGISLKLLCSCLSCMVNHVSVGRQQGNKAPGVHRPSPLCCALDMAGPENHIPNATLGLKPLKGKLAAVSPSVPQLHVLPRVKPLRVLLWQVIVVVWDTSCPRLPPAG